MARKVEKVIEVNAPVETCFRVWMDFENYPTFMKHVERVQATENPNIWHWEIKGPFGKTLQWDAQIDFMEPNKVIAWKSVHHAEIATTGSVNFQPEPNERTRIYFSMSYEPPGGGLGEFIAGVIEDPDKLVEDALIGFKKHMEHRDPTSEEEQRGVIQSGFGPQSFT